MTRAHKSKIYLAKVIVDLERVVRNLDNTFFLTTFHKRGRKMQEKIDASLDALWSDIEGHASVPKNDTKPALEPFLQFLDHQQFRAMMKEIVVEEARCI